MSMNSPIFQEILTNIQAEVTTARNTYDSDRALHLDDTCQLIEDLRKLADNLEDWKNNNPA